MQKIKKKIPKETEAANERFSEKLLLKKCAKD